MPLTSKGEKIKAAMVRKEGEKHGTAEFYASRNAGTISGVDGNIGSRNPTIKGSQMFKVRDGDSNRFVPGGRRR
jgi:hypothetical protein